jgi:hypothetical protein
MTTAEKTGQAWERLVAQARAVPIKTMCKHLNVELMRGENDDKGESWYGVCPLCPGHAPGFHVSPRAGAGRGLYYCRDCSSGGDSLSLYMAVKGVDFATAVREVANVR